MIIKVQLREQDLICVSYEQSYLEMNKDPMIHKYDCYHSTLEITFMVLFQNYYDLYVNKIN